MTRAPGAGQVRAGVDSERLPSRLEAIALNRIERAGLPLPVREYRFAPPRRWRFDFAWLKQRVAVEIEGGTWSPRTRGHTSGAGYQANLEKYNRATLLGWWVLRFNDHGVEDGILVQELAHALEVRHGGIPTGA